MKWCAAALALVLLQAPTNAQYSVTQLSLLSGASGAGASCVNDNNVVGGFNLQSGFYNPSPMAWSNSGTPISYSTTGGGSVVAINQGGYFVGESPAFVSNAQASGVTYLSSYATSGALGINNDNVIVGYRAVEALGQWEGVIWYPGIAGYTAAQRILPGDYGYANGATSINNDGTITMWIAYDTSGGSEPQDWKLEPAVVFFDPELGIQISFLDMPERPISGEADSAVPLSINDNGVVVGYALWGSSSIGIVWYPEGGYTVLEGSSSNDQSMWQANHVSNEGLVTGFGYFDGFNGPVDACVWSLGSSSSVPTLLADLLDEELPTGWKLENATWSNADGIISGVIRAYGSGGAIAGSKGVLLTPN
jgi:hypothetical protein